MTGSSGRPRLLLVGGTTGLVGRHILTEFSSTHQVVSLHRHPSPGEATAGAEFVPGDVGSIQDWSPFLRDVDLIVNVTWYRPGRSRLFRPVTEGLLRLVTAADQAKIPRFVHISVPDAPATMETDLPYLSGKRQVDRAIEASGLDYAIVRPTMLFGPRDVLLTVMLRTIRRYHLFPMFGDGEYHVSPISVTDLASILRREGDRGGRRNLTVGGPRRWRYRDLTDAMFRLAGLPPRYVHLRPSTSVRLAAFLETVGSTLLYAYEVEWLLADMLGLPPYVGLDRPLADAEPFLREQLRVARPGRPVRAAPNPPG